MACDSRLVVSTVSLSHLSLGERYFSKVQEHHKAMTKTYITNCDVGFIVKIIGIGNDRSPRRLFSMQV